MFCRRSLRAVMAGPLVMLVALSSAAAHAESPEVQRYLFAASQLHANLEYERALEQVQRARTRAQSMEDDVLIALWEGVIANDLGKADQASAAFRTALLLNPNAKLPVRVSPRVAKEFEALRASVKAELAPMLARQEAERKEKEEQARLEAERKQKEEQARLEADAKRVAEEKAEAEARAKREAEERRRLEAEERARAEAESDRPERVDGSIARTPTAAPTPYAPSLPAAVEKPGRSWVLPSVFAGLAVAAAGGGGYFGLDSRRHVESARTTAFQSDAVSSLNQANQSALIANVLFVTAGTAAVGSLLTVLLGGEPSQAQTAGGGGR